MAFLLCLINNVIYFIYKIRQRLAWSYPVVDNRPEPSEYSDTAFDPIKFILIL